MRDRLSRAARRCWRESGRDWTVSLAIAGFGLTLDDFPGAKWLVLTVVLSGVALLAATYMQERARDALARLEEEDHAEGDR